MTRPKTTTLDSLAAQEQKHYVTAQKRLGAPHLVAHETKIFPTTFIDSASKNLFTFAVFTAIFQNHQTISLFSIVRFHHVQAMMNLRQFLESESNAAFILTNNLTEYIDEITGFFLDPKKLSLRSNKWLEAVCQAHDISTDHFRGQGWRREI